MVHGKAAALALSALLTPAGGYHAHFHRGRAASFRVGAAMESIAPPLHGQAPGGDAADCDPSGAFSGPRPFAFEEPYVDMNGNGHFDPGEPYLDCDHNGRWEGNLLGGGASTPRYFTRVADPVTARAMVVSVRHRSLAVEVLDQEGLFNIYQQRIRAKVLADGYHLGGIFISANHDESAPDSLGLGGVTQATSGVNDYWVDYMVDQSAGAIERAYRARRRARIRYTEVLEPRNARQCWSSYPFVDDQHVPVLEAVRAGRRASAIVTLASVSQHVETLGFNGGTEGDWASSDWAGFFRDALQRRLGGVAIEMAGSVGSVESPEVYSRAISRTPQEFVDASHPAGCRTTFLASGGSPDVSGSGHVPIGYRGETRAFGQDLARPVIRALTSGAYHYSRSRMVWGQRSDICVPLHNELFVLAAAAGVFAQRPGYNSDCSVAAPVLPTGSTSGQSLRSEVAAFRIGDGEFLSIPGEVFPFTFLRSFLGPQDMQTPADALAPWLVPHMHVPFRFIDGLGEDMLGYIFPSGNSVGIPSSSDLNPSSTDRFGCAHSDDSEAASADAANIIGGALVRILDAKARRAERVVVGRYLLPRHVLSRDPLGAPELKCSTDTKFAPAVRPARAVQLAGGKVVRPRVWMSLSGLPQRRPDRDTRGYFDWRGRRVWLDVFPESR